MSKELRILMLEDVPDDAALAVRELERAGLGFTWERVDTKEEFLRALREFGPDLILSDFRLPTFDGMSAMLLARTVAPSVPCIILTGSMNEETAVECMRAGAADYVIKEHMSRLGQAVRSVLHKASLERQKADAEAALRQNWEFLKTVLDNANDAIFATDAAGRLILVNERACELSGYTERELRGRRPSELVPPGDAAAIRAELRKILSTGSRGERKEITLIRRDGTRIWVEFSGSPLMHGDRVAGAVGVANDVTERRSRSAALRESEERYRWLFDNNPLPMWVYDLETLGFLAVNDAAVEKYGYTRDDFLAMTLADIRPPEDVPALLANLAEERPALQVSGPWKHRLKEGRIIDVEIASHLLQVSGRQAVLVVAKDITAELAAKRALEESERRYRRLFERNLAGVFTASMDGRILSCNAAFASMHGYASPDEMQGMPLSSLDVTSPAHEPFARKIGRERVLLAVERGSRRMDGSEFAVLLSAAVVGDPGVDGELIEGVIMDISDLRRAEAQRGLLATAIEQSHDAVVVTDREGTILYVNPIFEKVTGYSREESIGRTPGILRSGFHGPEFYRDMWETILSGRVFSGQMTNRRKDGSLFVEHSVITPVTNASGEITAFVAVKRDVTEEMELQKRLEQAKKLETVGLIAGGLAHEVRNPLFAITTVVTALEKKLAGDESVGEYVAHINHQVGRLKTMMNDLLTLGRPLSADHFQPVHLGGALRQAVSLLEGISPGARRMVAIEDAGNGPVVLGAEDKLVQVFLNVIHNATLFSSPAGRVRVRVWSEDATACVAISDEGPGIPEDLLPRLFEPFQSRRKGGTGLGLAIVRQIVSAHGGTVAAANNASGRGATFTVRLPLA